ncbi:carboxymuconolactone decarboxylase family protein [Mycobacterium florentinum]|uniref:carboxymuconolactone decarboxylase family protein n=1 Tax=Mycobacterium florentinum TaxID=292462 RepID=UPI000A14E4F1|nr:carboxymuconolactone decarboxylase family protein [Mycobacterium florentinum]MCV7413104.1 carboxymuconolactone decarboxylase family protein [Mycobacterium florentinum]
MRNRFKTCAAVSAAALIISGSPSIAPRSTADGCGDVAPALVPPSGSAGPVPVPQAPSGNPPWLAAVQQHDPQFGASYQGMRERILKDGAIPAKYKFLMGMVTDTIAAHPDGVRSLADNARAAGASEAEITEAVEVGYLYGGTAALVMGVNAFPGN